jgi:hypothetical protein
MVKNLFCCHVCRLLSPEVDSPSALFIGSFVTQLIMQLSGQMAPHIGDLIAALVSTACVCKIGRSHLMLCLLSWKFCLNVF